MSQDEVPRELLCVPRTVLLLALPCLSQPPRPVVVSVKVLWARSPGQPWPSSPPQPPTSDFPPTLRCTQSPTVDVPTAVCSWAGSSSVEEAPLEKELLRKPICLQSSRLIFLNYILLCSYCSDCTNSWSWVTAYHPPPPPFFDRGSRMILSG